MAHLTRQTVTQPIPAKAKIITKGKECFAVWTDKKKRKIKAPVSECGTRCTVTLPEWYLEYRNDTGKPKRIKLFSSRKKSQIQMGEILKGLEQGEEIRPTTTRRELKDCIRDWIESLTAKGCNQVHINNCQFRIGVMLDAIQATYPKTINPHKLEQWLAQQRQQATIPNFRAKRMSTQTSNHYLKTAKAFCNYLVKHDLLTRNPLVVVDPLNADHQRTFERQPLTTKELWHLINTTIKNRCERSCLTATDRAMVYLIAAYTGFRLDELNHLKPESFQFEPSPTVALSGEYTKNGQDALQPLPKKVAAKIKVYLAKKTAGRPIWTATSFFTKHASATLRKDLQAAKIAIPSDGKKTDFHAFRTFYITSLALAGIPVQHATKLARLSSVEIMMKHYAKIGVGDLANQVNLIDIE